MPSSMCFKNEFHPKIVPTQKILEPEVTTKVFVSMRKSCCNTNTDGEKSNTMRPRDVKELQGLYKEYHEEGCEHRLIFLQTISDFALDEKNEEPCANVIESIVEVEDEIHEENNSRFECLYKTLNFNLDLAQYVVDAIDRNSFFSQIKQSIVRPFKKCLGGDFPGTIYRLSITFTALWAVQNIIVAHFDLLFDANIFASLNHTLYFFIGDEEKAVKISNMPLELIGYVYLGSGFLSQICIHLLYLTCVKKFINAEESWMHKVVIISSVLFPMHFMVLEVARCLLIHMILKNNLRKQIIEVMKKNANVEHASEKYIELRLKIQSNLDYLLSIQNTIIKILILELICENLTQTQITVSFIASELTNDYGKLMQLVSNTLLSLLGVDLSTLCILMVLLQLKCFSGTLLTIKSRQQFLLGHGIGGSIMLLAGGGVMVGTKIALLSILFSNASFIYPVFTLLELMVTVAFCKLAGIPLEMFGNVLPCAISPSLLLIGDKSVKRLLSKEWFELMCISSLHFLNLTLAYVPMFLIIEYSGFFNSYRSSHHLTTHAAVVTAYALSIILYGVTHYLYNNYGTPWRHLRVVLAKKKENISMQGVKTLTGREEEGEILMPSTSQQGSAVRKAMVDAITNKSYMAQNMREVNRKLQDRKKSPDS